MRKTTLLLIVLLLCSISLSAQTTSIPDPVFEQYLLDKGIDTDGTLNAQVLTADISSITLLNIDSRDYSGLSNMTGIEDFTSLEDLRIPDQGSLSNLNVTQNTNLLWLDISFTNISNVDLSNNTALTHFDATVSNISLIDFSNNPVIEYIALLDTELNNIVLTSHLNLNYLSIRNVNGTGPTSLDLSGCPALNTLNLNDLGALTTLDLSNNTALTSIMVRNTAVTALDLSDMSNLTSVSVYTQSFTSQLITLNLKNGNNGILTNVNITGNEDLICVQVDNGPNAQNNVGVYGSWQHEPQVMFGNNCNLTYVPDDVFEQYLIDEGHDNALNNYVFTDNISSITLLNIDSRDYPGLSNMTGIVDFTALEDLRLPDHGSLSYLDVTQNPNLLWLDISFTSISNVDLSNNTALTHFDATVSNISSMDFSNNPVIEYISLAETELNNIVLTSHPNLNYLSIGNNAGLGPVSLNLSGCQALSTLNLDDLGFITTLNLSNNTALTSIKVRNTAVTALDLSDQSGLTSVSVYTQSFTSQLNSLNLKNGNNGILTNVNITGNENLTFVLVDNGPNAQNDVGVYSSWQHDPQVIFSTLSNDFVTTWKTDEPGTSNTTSITIPTFLGETYNYEVDWTYDGVSFNAEDANVSGDITHDYGVAGIYTVAIRGIFPRIYFNFNGDYDKIQTIEQWSANPWTSMERAFAGCTNLNITNGSIDVPDLSNVASTQSMFESTTTFNGDLSAWNVSNISDMKYMFYNCVSFNQDISAWNVGNVVNMQEMFAYAYVFNQDIGSWNTINVETLNAMFAYASVFDQNLGAWDLTSITQMDGMFDNSTLSTENYDNTLIGWATDSSGIPGDGTDDIPTGITFSGGYSDYCNGSYARQSLIDDFSWSIVDGYSSCPSDYFITTWKTDESGSSNNTSISIPTFPGETYHYDVDWTYDGISFNADEQNVTGDLSHDYGATGTYTIAIQGVFPRIYFNFTGDNNKIQTIEQWGANPWTSMESAFAGCTNLNITKGSIDVPDLSNVASTEFMFNYATTFNGDLSAWDVSNISNMRDMFNYASAFNQDISAWNVSNVTHMSWMFSGTLAFNQDISAWNVSNVTEMLGMFSGALAFNQDISAWNVSGVTNMRHMFSYTDAFNQDISAWDVSNVINMRQMFIGASAFDQNLGAWDLTSVTTMENMFTSSTLSTENYDNTLIGWATDSSGTPGDGTDDVPTGITFSGGYSDYCNGLDARQSLIDDFSWSIVDGNSSCPSSYFITTWKTDEPGTSNATSISIPTFPGEIYHYDVDWTYDGISFNEDEQNVTGDVSHDYGTAGTYTIAIKGIFPRIYFNNSGDKEKIQTIEQWGANPWTSMERAFYGCANLNITNGSIDVPDLSNVASTESMFNSATTFNGNLSAWDVSNISNMAGMFFRSNSFNQNISAWNVSNVTYMGSMFSEAHVFNQDISSWNVSGVTNMGDMFRYAYAFNQDISGWNVSNVTTMWRMFLNASAFNQDISGWNVSNVEDMNSMFSAAVAFNQDISAWNVSNVTDMVYMFSDASAFDQNLGAWDLTSITTMGFMFENSTLSTENYDNTLIGWATDSSGIPGDGTDDIPNGITFNGGNSNYCNGAYARQSLIDDFSWSIVDGNLSCSPSDYFITNWKTDEPGSSNNTSISIPTFLGETYNYEVDWTYDGISFNADEQNVTGDISHDYGAAGTYTIAIQGAFPRIHFNNSGDKEKIQTIEQWGTNPWTSMESAFYGCANLNITNGSIDVPDLSNVTDMSYMFESADAFNGDVSAWDVSNVTDMNSMFDGASAFNQDISAWNVSNVTNMSWMFAWTEAFNQDISAWNVSNVTDMDSMFKNAVAFNQDISAWNVSNVTNMWAMFRNASAFDQNLGAWDLTSITHMEFMFTNNTLSTENYDNTLLGWATDSSGIPGDGIDDVPTGIYFDGGLSDYCNGVYARQSLIDDFSWSIVDGNLACSSSNYFITTWKTDEPGSSNNTSITIPTFLGETYDYEVDWTYDGISFNSDEQNVTGDVSHDYGTAGTYTIAIQGIFPRIYFNNIGDKEKIQTIEQWGTNPWTSMEHAFYGCANLNITNGSIDVPDLSNVASAQSMFQSATIFNGDLSACDVSNISNMRDMFNEASAFNQDISTWNVSNVTDMGAMFFRSNNFNQDISAWNVSGVTNMNHMFRNASVFDQNLGAWNVSNVTSMRRMFTEASAFNQNLGAWNVSNVTDMDAMFSAAHDFNQDISAWNVSNVTDMGNMFDGATDFNQDISAWNVSNVTDMRYMFSSTNAFNQDISAWNVSNVTDMGYMFTFANAFNQNLGAWDLTSITLMEFMFEGSTLSIENYDNTLIGWATDSSGTPGDGTDDIPTGISFDGGFSHYCNGLDARQSLIDDFSWSIVDGNSSCPSDYFITTWKTDEPGSSNNTSISIPTFPGETYLYEVDWTYDGISFNADNQNVTGDVSHDYGAVGTYTIAIRGAFPRIYFNFTGDREKIQTIEQWGTNPWTSMEHAFTGCANLNITNGSIDVPDLSNVASTELMFAAAGAFNGDLSAWNVSNITNMAHMFNETSAFNQDISAWNVSNVTDMSYMFRNTSAFDQNLGAWDLTSITLMGFMFGNSTLSTENYDNTLIGWATDSSGIPGDGTDDIPMGISFDGGSSNYCNGAYARQSLIDDFSWSIVDGNLACSSSDYFITTWKTDELGSSNNNSISIPTFLGETYHYDVDWTYDGISFNADEQNVTGDISHDYGTTGTYTIAIKGIFPRIYFNFTGDREKIQTIEQWGAIHWTSMEHAFTGCANLNIINGSIDVPDLSNVASAESMFAGAGTFNGDLSAWDVSNVTNMNSMFSFTDAFNQDISAWNVSGVTNMSQMFRNAFVFNQDISAWNVSGVTDMSHMFRSASAFNQDISAWNVSNVTDMRDMFSDATFNQDISAWNVSNVTSMWRMFLNASAFDQNLGAWDLTSITTMESMFDNSTLSTENYDNTLIGWATDDSGTPGDGVDDIPTGISFDGGNSVYCNSETQRQSLMGTFGWIITDGGLDPLCNAIVLSPKVYLQGAYINPNDVGLMNDALRVASLIPTTSPYADMLVANTTVFDLGGTSGSGAVDDDIVDWVWVELRDENDNTTIIDSQSALLQRDGDIVGVDGISTLSFDQLAGNYYVAIAHRNHLGIITANTVSLSSSATVLDLSNDSALINGGGNAVVDMGNSDFALYAGDYDNNGQIQNSDLTQVTTLLGTSGYSDADSDMNSQVQNADINNIISPNVGNGEQSKNTSIKNNKPLIIAPLSETHKRNKL